MTITQQPVLTLGPNAMTPLAARVDLETDGPATIEITLSGPGGDRTVSIGDGTATSHSVPVIGMRPGSSYTVSVSAIAADGSKSDADAPIAIDTPALPDDFPPISLMHCDAERREPGYTLFPTSYVPTMKVPERPGYLVIVDREGEIVWWHRHPSTIFKAQRNPVNGNFVFTADDHVITEIDLLGDVQQRYLPQSAIHHGDTDGTEIQTEMLHHSFSIMPNGNYLGLSLEVREYDGWPPDDEDKDAEGITAKLVGDIVVEFTPDGEVVNEFKMLDLVDPYRIGYGSHAPFWRFRGYPDTYDWSHANAVFYSAQDDTVLVSLRVQDVVLKIDRKSGEVIWLLGDHRGWKEPWQDKLLTPQGDGFEWQYHQHDVSVTPSGTVMMFDNGTARGIPFDGRTPAPKNHSRAVEFAVDDAAKTISEQWSYVADSELYSTFVSGSQRLAKTGNTLVDFGGITKDDDGNPSDNNMIHHVQARLVELEAGTDERVFELKVHDPTNAIKWNSFRMEHLDDIYPA